MSLDRSSLVADKHEIETLQRLYAKATDTIGLASPEKICLLYTSPSPRDATLSRMPSSA